MNDEDNLPSANNFLLRLLPTRGNLDISKL